MHNKLILFYNTKANLASRESKKNRVQNAPGRLSIKAAKTPDKSSVAACTARLYFSKAQAAEK